METNETYKKLSDITKFDENPFIDIESLKRDLKKKRRSHVFKPQLGNAVYGQEDYSEFVLEDIALSKNIYDFPKWFKVYPPFFKNLRLLNSPGIDILSILFEKISYECTTVHLREDELMHKFKWRTKKNFYKGLVSLINYNYLARSTSPHKFFINPYMIFRGNLATLLKVKNDES